MLGNDRACFWHEPLLLLATCFNKSVNDNQKPHLSFLMKSFKNIKNTHDLSLKKKKATLRWLFQKQKSTSKLWNTENWSKLCLGYHLVCLLTGEKLEAQRC